MHVDVRGILRLDAPTGRQLAVRADGACLHVDVPGLAEIRAAAPGSMRGLRRRVRQVDDALRACGLKLSLESSGRPFLTLGHETRGNWLARVLGLAPACLRPSVIGLILRR